MRFLLALHVLLAGMYALVGVLRALFTVFANAATIGSLWSLLSGAASAGVAAGLLYASRRGSGRNRAATHLITLCAVAFLILEIVILEVIVYRLVPVPAAAWLLTLPTVAFILLSGRSSWQLLVGRGPVHRDSTGHTEAPVSPQE